MVGGIVHNSEYSMVKAPEILTRDDGGTIAYHRIIGKSPGVMFLTGFKSDMTGSKAIALEELCRRRGQGFIRFDYFGHGQSSGAFEDGTIGRWKDDAICTLDQLTEGPQVIVGSSMGGWIMLLTALARPKRIAGLVGTAAAPDFTEDLMPDAFPNNRNNSLKATDTLRFPIVTTRNPIKSPRRCWTMAETTWCCVMKCRWIAQCV